MSPGERGGGYEIRTREGVNPTRFPSPPAVVSDLVASELAAAGSVPDGS